MRIEDALHGLVGPDLGPQAIVVRDVRLDDAGGDRPLDRLRGQRTQPHRPVAGQHRDQQRQQRQRHGDGGGACASSRGDDGRTHAFVPEEHCHRQPGDARDVGRLAQRARRVESEPETVAEQLRQHPLRADVGAGADERDAGRAEFATAGGMPREREHDQLRLEERRRRERDHGRDPERRARVVGHGDGEPVEHDRAEHGRHHEPRRERAAPRRRAIERQEPGDEEDPTEVMPRRDAGGREPAAERRGRDRARVPDARQRNPSRGGTSRRSTGMPGGTRSGGTMRSAGIAMGVPFSSVKV